MAVPNTFTSGDIASSAEVNENFDYLSDVVGNDSDAEAMKIPGTIILGPRQNVQISAESDTAYGDDSFVQIGWNTELYFASSQWNVRRFLADEVASALRVGRLGLEFYTTSNVSGSLNSRLNKVFGIRAIAGSDRVFIKSDVHIQRTDDSPSDLTAYRLTYVPFENPVAIYENNNIYKGTKNRIASVHGVPEHAIAIELVAYVKANVGVPGTISFMRTESTPTLGSGFAVYAASGAKAYGSGIVHLGSDGSNNTRFIEERDVNFAQASLFIKGYYT